MDKTITIDGRSVRFAANGATPVIYRSATGRDYFRDIVSMRDMADDMEGTLDTSTMYSIIYTLAKQGGSVQGTMEDWLSTFDSFPVFTVFAELGELMRVNMAVLKK